MIAFFPELKRDQLLFDAIGKFQDRVNYSSRQTVSRRLFGNPNVGTSMDFISRLKIFVTQLPIGHAITVDALIDNHSLLPYFAPFYPEKVISQIRLDMEGEGSQRIHGRLGIKSSKIATPQWMRFCPQCVCFEREKYGECYWHRVAQLPGVLICPQHHTPLLNSKLPAYDRKLSYRFCSAETILKEVDLETEQIPLEDPQFKHLIAIAENSLWLLNNPQIRSNPVDVRQRYRNVLIERGLISYSGQIKKQKFQTSFLKFYSPEFLDLISCRLDPDNHGNWLLQLVRTAQRKNLHPLYHILLIQFLGHTLESFFNLPIQINYFGSGPWPCLNAVCQYYQQRILSDIDVTYSASTGRLLATFACECGFTYARSGPDKEGDDIFRRDRIVSFGSVWINFLKENWGNPQFSLRSLARALGVDPNTVNYQARKLNLSIPRPGYLYGQKIFQELPKSREQLFEEAQKGNRSKWIEATEKYPDFDFNQLKAVLPNAYVWLHKHDTEWLKANRPVRKQRNYRLAINWTYRDLSYLPLCLKSILHSQPEKKLAPLTFTSIARGTGKLYIISAQKSKLPQTISLIDSFVESRSEYAIRRIWHSVEKYQQEASITSSLARWQLVRRSGTGFVDKIPEIDDALNRAVSYVDKWHRTSQNSVSQPPVISSRKISHLQDIIQKCTRSSPDAMQRGS